MKVKARYTNTVENTPPLTLSSVEASQLDDYKIYGNSIQNGTPTPETPIEVESCGDEAYNMANVQNLVGGRNIEVDSNGTIKLNATNIYVNKTLRQLCPDVQVGDVLYLSLNAIGGARPYIWLNGGASGSQWVNETWHIITQAEIDTSIKLYCTDTSNSYISNLIITKDEIDKYKISVMCFDGAYWGKVDLSTLNYDKSTSNRYYVQNLSSLNMGYDRESSSTKNIYFTNNSNKNILLTSEGNVEQNPLPVTIDGTITIGIITQTSHDRMGIISPNYTTANELKQALSGTYLYYPLATAPTPLVQPTTTNIYLNEPLRKIGNVSDYIDFKNGKVVRNNDEIASYNGETITTSYISSTGGLDVGSQVVYQLLQPTEESITLPSIPTFKGTNIISAMTTIQPSNMSNTYRSGANANGITTWGKIRYTNTKGNNVFTNVKMQVNEPIPPNAIYWLGNQCIDKTGGWEVYNSGNTHFLHNINQIDLSVYSKVVLQMENFTKKSSGTGCKLEVNTVYTTYNNDAIADFISQQNGIVTCSFPLSSAYKYVLVGNSHPVSGWTDTFTFYDDHIHGKFAYNNNYYGCEFDIVKIWLE